MTVIIRGANLGHVGYLPYPVLVVPDGQQFHAIRTITLACEVEDIRDGIPVPLDFLSALKEAFLVRFEVVHFTTGVNDEKAVVEVYHWKQALGEALSELHFIQAGSLEEGVMRYLATYKADWLMIFPKKHRLLEFHRSGSKRIVMHCPVPVLSVSAYVKALVPNDDLNQCAR